MNEICFGPMMIDASQASHPAGNIAFKYNDTATGWNSLYAAYNRGLDVSAFSALNLTASSDISAKQGDDPRGYVSISLRQRRNDAGIAWHEIEEKQLSGNKVSAVSVSGAASTGKIVATSDKYWDEPWVRIIGFWDESGTILNRTFYNDWQFSGVLR